MGTRLITRSRWKTKISPVYSSKRSQRQSKAPLLLTAVGIEQTNSSLGFSITVNHTIPTILLSLEVDSFLESPVKSPLFNALIFELVRPSTEKLIEAPWTSDLQTVSQ